MYQILLLGFMLFRNQAANTGRTFTKSVVLLTSPSERKVPAGEKKLKLYLSKFIIDAVEVSLTASNDELKKYFNELFAEKLGDAK